MKFKLKPLAEINGYGPDLCTFLDNLEKGYFLWGTGRGSVCRAIREKADEQTVAKVALANMGRVLPGFYSEEQIKQGIKPDYDFTTADWAARGEAKYKEHVGADGKFRYSDFAR